MEMTLMTMCINVIARENFVEKNKNSFKLLPANVKSTLLTTLCKRGCIKDVHILKQLINPRVVVIDLSECEVNNEILSCLMVCKYLQKLDLSLRRRQSRTISSEVLNKLFKHLPHLRFLAIPHCKEVNDTVIETVSENCKNLVELHIPNSSITNQSLYFIGQNLKNLSVINILGSQIDDEGIEYLTAGSLSENLVEINIDKCPNITPHSSSIIAEKCPNIKIYTCGSCGNNEELYLAMNGIRSKAKQVFWSV